MKLIKVFSLQPNNQRIHEIAKDEIDHANELK